jgi:membrane-associated phospholipid phosphatase
MPPFAVPGHASFPSGHATQSALVAGLLAQVLPPAVTRVNPPKPGMTPPAEPASLLDRMAERLARNREVVGLHYASDSRAGRELAAGILRILAVCPATQALIVAARAEWQNRAPLAPFGALRAPAP